MAINKKLVHFKTFANFQNELNLGNILDTSIVFIKDKGWLYSHGKYYYCDSHQLSEDYAKSQVNSEPIPEDTLEEAISKLHKAITDNTEATSSIHNNLGFTDSGYSPEYTLVLGLNVTLAIDYALNKIDDLNSVNAVTSSDIVDNLTTDNANKVLSAKLGKVLQDTKVDKVTGKGLSTNDYTTTEKTKLSGIEEGALVNTVNSVAGKTGTITLDTSDISGLDEYATQTWVLLQNYLTEHLDISNLATKGEVSAKYTKPANGIPATDLTESVLQSLTKADTAIQSLDGYATESYVGTLISNLVGSAPETLDTLAEIATALQNNEEVVEALDTAVGEKINKAVIGSTASSATDATTTSTPYLNTVSGSTVKSSHKIEGSGKVSVNYSNSSKTLTISGASATVSDKSDALEWDTSVTIASVDGTNITAKLPANPNTDTSVTSVTNHYTPVEDSTQTITATGGTSTNVTSSTNKQNVVTGIKRDSAGHITGVEQKAIYSTDTTVTSVSNHYTPSGGSAITLSSTDADITSASLEVITGITKDAAGHITGVTSANISAPHYTNALTIKGGTTDVCSFTQDSAATVSFIGGSNVTVTPDATNNKITIAATDSKVTSSDNHYTPSSGTEMTATSSSKNITGFTGQLDVITGVSIDDKGHLTSVTKAKVYSTDTKNSTGASNLDSTKLFLVGALDQTSNPTTYTNSGCYIGTDGNLYSNGSTVLTSHLDISGKADKATTLAGYGITDAKISNGTITLGTNTITPLTSHYGADRGISISDNSYGHSNTAITAKTSAALLKVKYDTYGHITGSSSVTKSDITGLGIPGEDTNTLTYIYAGSGTSAANDSTTNGNTKISVADDSAINGSITIKGTGGATVTSDSTGIITINSSTYIHPTGGAASKSSDFYKFSTNSTSHINSVTKVTKDDITSLGIPAENTTYEPGTGLSLSSGTFNHSNSITSGTVLGSSGSVASAGTINIPKITYDALGHITETATTSVTMPTIYDRTSLKILNSSGTSLGTITGNNTAGVSIKAGDNITLTAGASTLTIKASYPEASSSESGLMTSSLYILLSNLTTFATRETKSQVVSSLANLDALTYKVFILSNTVSTGSSLSISTSPSNILSETHIIILPYASADRTFTIPNNSSYHSVNGETSYTVKAGEYGEINIIKSEAGLYYIRTV